MPMGSTAEPLDPIRCAQSEFSSAQHARMLRRKTLSSSSRVPGPSARDAYGSLTAAMSLRQSVSPPAALVMMTIPVPRWGSNSQKQRKRCPLAPPW